MWIRGYAFEVDCARSGRTSGAPRSSAPAEAKVSVECLLCASARMLLKMSESEKASSVPAKCQRLYSIWRGGKSRGEYAFSFSSRRCFSCKVCRTTHVSVVLMRLLRARRRPRESFAQTRASNITNSLISSNSERAWNTRVLGITKRAVFINSAFARKTQFFFFYKQQTETRHYLCNKYSLAIHEFRTMALFRIIYIYN